MAALISTVMSTKDKVPFFVNRCAEMDIEVLPPDVNSSDHGFVVSGNSIRFGLDAVKNVGHIAVQAILDAHSKDGDFTLAVGFLRARRQPDREQAGGRVPGQVRSLRLDRRIAQGHARSPPGRHRLRPEGAGGLAARPVLDLRPRRRGGGGRPVAPAARPRSALRSSTQRELLRLEKETLGTFLSSHPLAEVKDALRARVDCSLSRLAERARRLLGDASAGSSPSSSGTSRRTAP